MTLSEIKVLVELVASPIKGTFLLQNCRRCRGAGTLGSAQKNKNAKNTEFFSFTEAADC
jgi:hypothetical protein